MGLVHICLDFKDKGGKVLAEWIDLSCKGLSWQGRGGHFQEMLQKGLHTEIRKGRTEKYRRKISPLHPVHIQLIAGAVQKLNVVHQLLVINGADDGFCLRAFCLKFPGCNLLCASHGSGKSGDFLCKAVVNTLEILSAADGPVHRTGADAQHVLDLI